MASYDVIASRTMRFHLNELMLFNYTTQKCNDVKANGATTSCSLIQ